MSWDLREKWSHRHGRTKSTRLYIFCFLLVSVHSNTVWLFLICSKPFSPLFGHFSVLICIENPFLEYGIFFTFGFLRFTYTIWFLKASNLNFITLKQITLPRNLSSSYSTNTQFPSLMLSGLIGKLPGSAGSTT